MCMAANKTRSSLLIDDEHAQLRSLLTILKINITLGRCKAAVGAFQQSQVSNHSLSLPRLVATHGTIVDLTNLQGTLKKDY